MYWLQQVFHEQLYVLYGGGSYLRHGNDRQQHGKCTVTDEI
jgi:hypothetical protein